MRCAKRSLRALLSWAALLLPLVQGGCMTARAALPSEHPGISGQTSFLVPAITFDDHGRPLFPGRLHERPGKAGAVFTVVHAINGLPSRSFDIAVLEPPRSGPGPLAVIYHWTGKGFEGGVRISSGIAPHDGPISSGPEAAAYLAVKTAPIVIATATGFVVGVLASIPETAKELGRVVLDSRETVTGMRTYAHDDQGRIRFMKLYPPEEHADALVSTEYFYEGAGAVPVRTEVESIAEGKVRQVP